LTGWFAVRSIVVGGPWQESAGLAMLTVILGGIGVVWLWTSYRNNRETMRRNRLAAAFPGQPWRWRPEWEAKRIPHRSRRFGTTILELRTLPGVPGGELAGAVVPSFRDAPAAGFHVTLTAVRVFVTGFGQRRRVHESVLWQGQCTAPLEPAGPRARFAIAIPDDAPATKDDDPNDEVVWRLAASADVDGRRFSADFVVPVFR
jgi:hypothetical protein